MTRLEASHAWSCCHRIRLLQVKHDAPAMRICVSCRRQRPHRHFLPACPLGVDPYESPLQGQHLMA